MRGRRNERGAALIEAAIIVPLLMLLTFGAIELGIGFSQKGAIESAARAGARKAATLTQLDEPDFSKQVAQSVNAALDSSAVPELKYLFVYQDTGGAAPSKPSDCASNCTYFLVDTGNKNHFDQTTPQGSGWSIPRNGCGINPDVVSVRIIGDFGFLTGLIGNGKVGLSATTTLQLEPLDC